MREAVEQLLVESPEVSFRITTQRGRSLIEGVEGGQFDLAVVTDIETVIRDAAGIEPYIEPLHLDRFIVVGNPPAKANWSKAWDSLPVRRLFTGKEIADSPLVLPEPDALRRQQFDRWFGQANNRSPNAILEVGGWMSLLQIGHRNRFCHRASCSRVRCYEAIPIWFKANHDCSFAGRERFPTRSSSIDLTQTTRRDNPDFEASAQMLLELHRVTSGK